MRLLEWLPASRTSAIAGGVRMATSVGGVLTGRGADVIIIDDPLKPDQALSDVGRKAVNDWYDNTLLSRLNNKRTGCIIIVMQRLHQDDLVGHVLPQDDWTVLSFPADRRGARMRAVRDALWCSAICPTARRGAPPRAEVVEEDEAMRRRIGLYNFSSQSSRRPNQVRPLTDAQPRIAEITRAEGCRRLRLPAAAYTLSFERKASPFFAKTQFEFPNPAVPTAAGIRVAGAHTR